MIVEFGHFALILAAFTAMVQAVVPLIGAHNRWPGWMAVARPAAGLQFFFTGLSFGALTYAFVTSDFTVQLVNLNSHSLKPVLYKVTGVWGNHEGSMLLWVFILTLFGACLAWFGGNLPPGLRARALSVQAAVGVAFYGFILFTSNPFERMSVAPLDGRGLNPILQDPGLALHPPFLYLGYVGLSVSFSFAIAALIEGRVDAAWARWVRPWTLAAWVFLTFGIVLGSWWAYSELGWGGIWFWDPVENASFMPWLLAAALLHSAIVVEKREALKSWTILLAILAFGFSLIGTFLVRSGVITSVHAFANDPERGVFILAILALFTGGGLVLFAARASAMEAKGIFGMVSRESALVVNNVLLAVSCFVVFVGTIWPLVSDIFFVRKLSVGAPFFDTAFTPFVVAMGVILPVGAILPWKRARLGKAMRPLIPALVLALGLAGLAWAMQSGRTLLGPVGLFLGAWLVFGALTDLYTRTGRGARGARLRRLARLPRADWGKAVAHAGLGVTIFAVAGLWAWEKEDIRVAFANNPFEFAGYEFTLERVRDVQGPNYRSTMADVRLRRDGRDVTVLQPEKRVYSVSNTPTTEAAIHYRFLRDIYVVLGDAQLGGGYTLRSYSKPLTSWLWIGTLMMALGGGLSLSDRRYRVAAGGRKAAIRGVPAQ